MNFKKNETAQKLRGGYYTPSDLADFLVRWVSVISPECILEPSCGDGVFFTEIAKHSKKSNVHAFELLEDEAKKAHRRASALSLPNFTLNHGDFLEWAVSRLESSETLYDAVLGNPPFIRYQYLPEEFQCNARSIFDALDCKFTKHTNAWVPFILASMALLKPGGRLAMVVPAEILHVTHAQSLRTYLGKQCSRLVVVDPEELWFEGTLQGAVLLLAEKKHSDAQSSDGLAIYPVKGREFLKECPEQIYNKPKSINGKTIEGKWTRAVLSQSTLSVLDGLECRKDVFRFNEVADVKVGIVTGANKFFLVDDETVDKYGLEKWAHPMFGRSEHCPGIIYDEIQHAHNATKGKPTNFVWFKGDDHVDQLPHDYIAFGEEQELQDRYKCRIREPWYSVPSVYSTEIGMLKRSHNTPRLIYNSINAYTTDTAYRVKATRGNSEQLVFSFVNALTSLSAEIEGRSYGGGVLELIPSEINRLLLPNPEVSAPNLSLLDKDVRSIPMTDVLEKQTKVVLGKLGVAKSEQLELLEGWKKLRDRRQRVSAGAA